MKYLVGPMDATVTCPLLPLTIKWILWLQTSVRQDSIMAKGPQIVILPSLNGQDQQTHMPVMYQSQEGQNTALHAARSKPWSGDSQVPSASQGTCDCQGDMCRARAALGHQSTYLPFVLLLPPQKKKRNSREFSSYWISRKESGKFWEVLCVQILWSCLSRKFFLAKQASAPGGMCMGDHEMSDCPTFFC